MNVEFVKGFVKSKKGKTMIAGAVGAAILHFFPGSADVISEWAHIIADIFTETADKVDPVVLQPPQ